MKKYSSSANDRQRDADAHQLSARRFQAVFLLRSFFAFIHGVQVRNLGHSEDDEQDGGGDADAHVGRGQAGIGVGSNSGGGSNGVGASCDNGSGGGGDSVGGNGSSIGRSFGGVIATENKIAADNRAENPAAAVDGLRDVDARRAVFRGAQHGGVRIGDGFQTGHAGRNHKQAEQERPVFTEADRVDKPKRPRRDQRQADQDAALVAELAGDEAGRNRHQKVGEIVGRLHEAGLFLVDVERVLKMLVQNVNHAVAKTPHQKQRGDERKGDEEVLAVSSAE